MESKVKLLGHPVHPMLIVFPLGLLITAGIFDVIYLITRNGMWTNVSYWMIVAGIIGGLAAGVFGLLDWLAIPADTRAKRIGLWHGVGNIVVLALFIVSWILRRQAPVEPEALAFVCSFLGIALGAVSGWLGGELVGRLAVGVDEGAHLNSPNSLSGRSARETAGGLDMPGGVPA